MYCRHPQQTCISIQRESSCTLTMYEFLSMNETHTFTQALVFGTGPRRIVFYFLFAFVLFCIGVRHARASRVQNKIRQTMITAPRLVKNRSRLLAPSNVTLSAFVIASLKLTVQRPQSVTVLATAYNPAVAQWRDHGICGAGSGVLVQLTQSSV